MKAKVNRGNGFRGLLDYALGESKNHEIVGGNMAGQTARELAAEFKVSRQLRPEAKNPVVQFSLALPPGEDVTAEKWQAITDDFVSMMKLDGHQFVAIKHNDTEHRHVHLIASRVSLDGSLWHGQWEAFRAIEATQKLEIKHGLTITPGLDSVDAEQHKAKLKKPELERALRIGEAPVRQLLQNIIDAAAEGSPSVTAFAERLDAAGVTLIPNVASTGKLNGFSFALDGIHFKGSDLGKSYAWRGLQQRGITYDQDTECGELIRRKERASLAQSPDGAGHSGSDQGSRPEPDDAERREPGDGTRPAEPHDEIGGRGGQVDREIDGKGQDERGGPEQGSETPGAGEPAESLDDAGGDQLARLHRWQSVAADTANLAAPAAVVAVEGVPGAGDSPVSKALKAKQDAWNRQASALGSPTYRITLKGRLEGLPTYNFGKAKDGTEHFYTQDEITKLLPKLSRENARGFDVYVTPIDPRHHYIVVDDMRDEAMKQLRADGFEPCLVQQSSHDNWQAIVKVPKGANEQSQANELVSELNRRYGDPKFSGVVHPFRLAGFSNKKPGKNGAFTRVVEAVQRVCTKAADMLAAIKDRVEKASQRTQERYNRERQILVASTAEGAPRSAVDAFRRAYAKHTGLARSAGWELDDSRLDWGATIDLLKAGYSREDVARALLDASPSVLDRHNDPQDYATRTVDNAMQQGDVVKARAQKAQATLLEKTEEKQTVKRSGDNQEFKL